MVFDWRADWKERPTPVAVRKRTGARATRHTVAMRGRDPAEEKTPAPPRLPRPPAPARLTGERARPVVGWPHLLVNGSDAEFRRALRCLAATVRRIDTIHDLAADETGINGAGLELLMAVAERDADGAGVLQPTLARHLGVSLYRASAQSGALAAKGLVEKRKRPGAGGRIAISLTPDGARAAARAERLILGAHNLAFGALTPREFAALRRIAGKLDEASASAVDIVARRVGELSVSTSGELAREEKRLRRTRLTKL